MADRRRRIHLGLPLHDGSNRFSDLGTDGTMGSCGRQHCGLHFCRSQHIAESVTSLPGEASRTIEGKSTETAQTPVGRHTKFTVPLFAVGIVIVCFPRSSVSRTNRTKSMQTHRPCTSNLMTMRSLSKRRKGNLQTFNPLCRHAKPILR
jgi:hypothetical protein